MVGASIEISGFEVHEIDDIVCGDDSDDEQSKTDDFVPELPSSAIAPVGDLFQLGPHRLICGDGHDPEVVQRLMQADVARLVFTDLAFDAAIAEHRMMRGQRGLAMASAATPDPPFRAFPSGAGWRRFSPS